MAFRMAFRMTYRMNIILNISHKMFRLRLYKRVRYIIIYIGPEKWLKLILFRQKVAKRLTDLARRQRHCKPMLQSNDIEHRYSGSWNN